VTRHCVLHFLWTGNIGGAERAVYQVVREQLERGEWEVGVAFGRAEGPYAEAIKSLGCKVLDLRMRSAVDLPRALQAVGQLREFDIHHFHVMEPTLIFASSRCDGVARIYTERGGLDTDRIPKMKMMRRWLGGILLRKYINAVAGNTAYASRVVVERYRPRRIPTHVTYNGIDFSLLTLSRDRTEVRRRLGAGPETLVVGSSGTLKAWKRFERVVELLGVLPDAHVLLVGDGALRGALEERARALEAGDRLHITGLIDSVADYVAAMDVFVLASAATESFGNSVVEAMALGVPSIVFSDSPGVCEHIQDSVTGFIVENQEALVSVVERIAADSALRSRVGLAGARHVRSAYTFDRMHDAYQALYEAALNARVP
jgi:glycosyltransferase involved in cell wall biosynthesis